MFLMLTSKRCTGRFESIQLSSHFKDCFSEILQLIKDYEMSTVTFGMNCAPYLAIRTLHQLSDGVKEKLPRESTILREYMYVDDVLAGAHSISEAIQARDEVTTALSSVEFSLRKLTSNSKSILSGRVPEHILNSAFLEFEDSSIAKTLAIRWNAQSY